MRKLMFSAFAAALSLAASPTLAYIEVRAKADETHVYGNKALRPPPVTSLAGGAPVTLMFRGPDRSLVQLEDGRQGWVHNRDLVIMQVKNGESYEIPEQGVLGNGWTWNPFILKDKDPEIEMVSLQRSFSAEIVEAMDREQTEMRHDEN